MFLLFVYHILMHEVVIFYKLAQIHALNVCTTMSAQLGFSDAQR
jgi:hypothetical protein